MVEFLKTNVDPEFDSGSISEEQIGKLSKSIKDQDYLAFLLDTNGGYFFSKSLHIYGLSDIVGHNLFEANELLQVEYGNIISGLVSFGEDVFGNQFMFDPKQDIYIVNIETGEKEFVGKGFVGWINTLKSDLEYLSGQPLASAWELAHGSFNYSQRLCPKRPFVIGGEYEIANLYTLDYPRYIEVNANIARQVHGLPEGQQIKIETI